MNLLFDYDGTLHDCIRIYAPAFRMAYAGLVRDGVAGERDYSDEEISLWLGYTPEDMWAQFKPPIPMPLREHCTALVGDEMFRLLQAGRAALYPGAEQVLKKLKDAGHTLLLLSNCQTSYLEEHRRYFALDRFFTACYCAEPFEYAPKWEIFETIRAEHPGDYVVIGDRTHDLEIARRNGLPAIGAAYGYGAPEELEGTAAMIGDITQLPGVLDGLFGEG